MEDWKKQAVPGLPEDWPERTAERVTRILGKVRKATDRPTANVARRLVYGSIAAVAATAAVILLIISGIRLLDAYLPAEVWAAYTILGGFFTALGLWIWAKRPARVASKQE